MSLIFGLSPTLHERWVLTCEHTADLVITHILSWLNRLSGLLLLFSCPPEELMRVDLPSRVVLYLPLWLGAAVCQHLCLISLSYRRLRSQTRTVEVASW